jgi:hypothetical protein
MPDCEPRVVVLPESSDWHSDDQWRADQLGFEVGVSVEHGDGIAKCPANVSRNHGTEWLPVGSPGILLPARLFANPLPFTARECPTWRASAPSQFQLRHGGLRQHPVDVFDPDHHLAPQRHRVGVTARGDRCGTGCLLNFVPSVQARLPLQVVILWVI